LFDVNVRQESSAGLTCDDSTGLESQLLQSNEYTFGNSRPVFQKSWSNDQSEHVLSDCATTADLPYGIRVAGPPSVYRNLVENGNFQNGRGVEGETGSYTGFGVIGNPEAQTSASCMRGSSTCLGRRIIATEDKSDDSSILNVLEYYVPSSIQGQTLVGMCGTNLPSLNGGRGCAAAAFSNGSPSRSYCEDIASNFRTPWWKSCCVWSDGSCKEKKQGILGEYELQLTKNQRIETRGNFHVKVWMRCSIDAVFGSNVVSVMSGQAFLTSSSGAFVDWRASGNFVHSVAKNDRGAAMGPCVNEWIPFSMTFASMSQPFRRIRVVLAYPLEMTAGTLQFSDISVHFSLPQTETLKAVPPSFRCVSCTLRNNNRQDLLQVGNTSAALIDTVRTSGDDIGAMSSSSFFMPSSLGDGGGYAVAGPLKPGDRVWQPATPINIVNNPFLNFGLEMDEVVTNVNDMLLGGDQFIQIGEWRLGVVENDFVIVHVPTKMQAVRYYHNAIPNLQTPVKNENDLSRRPLLSRVKGVKLGTRMVEWASKWRLCYISGGHVSLSYISNDAIGDTRTLWRDTDEHRLHWNPSGALWRSWDCFTCKECQVPMLTTSASDIKVGRTYIEFAGVFHIGEELLAPNEDGAQHGKRLVFGYKNRFTCEVLSPTGDTGMLRHADTAGDKTKPDGYVVDTTGDWFRMDSAGVLTTQGEASFTMSNRYEIMKTSLPLTTVPTFSGHVIKLLSSIGGSHAAYVVRGDLPAPLITNDYAVKKFSVCVWARFTIGFDANENKLILPFWETPNGTTIVANSSVMTSSSASSESTNTWSKYCRKIHLSSSPARFTVVLGRTQHTVGSVEVTGLSIFRSDKLSNANREEQSNRFRFLSAPPSLLGRSDIQYVTFPFDRSGKHVLHLEQSKTSSLTKTSVCCNHQQHSDVLVEIEETWTGSGIASTAASPSLWRAYPGKHNMTGYASGSLKCFYAFLPPGTYRPRCTGEAIGTGFFLQTPQQQRGGTCPDACPPGALACSSLTSGTICYGCAVRTNNQENHLDYLYDCSQGLKIFIIEKPPTFSNPSVAKFLLQSTDYKCTNWTYKIDGDESVKVTNVVLDARHSILAVSVPVLPLGVHDFEAQVHCTNPLTSKTLASSQALKIEWTVIDPRDTNTSIVGPTTTKDSSVVLELSSNKAGCSFVYQINGRPSQTITGASSSRSIAARIVAAGIPPSQPWRHDTLLVVTESSGGAGIEYTGELYDVNKNRTVVLPLFLSTLPTEQAHIVLHDLVQGVYELTVHIPKNKKTFKKQIVVEEESISTWMYTNCPSTTWETAAIFEIRDSISLSSSSTTTIYRYRYVLDDDESKKIEGKGSTLILSELSAGIHTLSILVPGISESRSLARYQWEVVDSNTVLQSTELSQNQACSSIVSSSFCGRPVLKIYPLSSSSQKTTYLEFGYDDAVLRESCGWRFTLDGGIATDSETPYYTLVDLSVGEHTLRVYSINTVTGSCEAFPPLVYSFKILQSEPWDVTEVRFEDLSHGWSTFHAVATDPLGKEDQVGTQHNIYIDHQRPVSVLLSERLKVLFHANWQVDVFCEDDNTVENCQQVEWSIGDAEWQTKTIGDNNKFHVPVVLDGGDGPKQLRIRATDAVGNIEQPPYGINMYVILDTVPPSVRISPFPLNSVFRHTDGTVYTRFGSSVVHLDINDTTLTTSICTESNQDLNCTGMKVVLPVTHADGLRTLKVQTTDEANFTTTTFYSIVVDKTSPHTVITTLGETTNITKETTMTMTVSATDALSGVAVVFCSLDGGEEIHNCNSNSQLLQDLKDGPHVFTAWAIDQVGNTHAKTPTSVGWVVDVTPPILIIPEASTSIENIMSISIFVTCTDRWSDCFVEYDIQNSADVESEQSCGPTYNWNHIIATTKSDGGVGVSIGGQGGAIDVPVLAFGTYIVSLRASDAVGNQAEISSQTVVVKTATTNPPRSLRRYAASSNNLTLSWEDPEFDSVAGITYVVQFSTSATFPDDPRSIEKAQTIPNVVGTSIAIPLSLLLLEKENIAGQGKTLHNTLIIARIRRAGAVDWSLPSDAWTISSECVDVQWLDTLSNKIEPTNWTCVACPIGASCVGDVTWTGVRGKFGYWRVPGIAPQTFEPCIFAGACLGAPNSDLANQFFMNGTDLAMMMTEAHLNETCNEKWGHNNNCGKDGRCRLCNSCRPNFKPGTSRGRCDSCPAERSTNALFMVLGVLVAIAGAAGIVALTIIAGGGVVEVSEATKKILINYLQVVSLAAVFPVRWPAHVESFFAFQSTISSVSKTLLSPDCELSFMTPSEAFYQKQVGFAFLPIVIVIVCNLVWFLARLYSRRSPSTSSKDHADHANPAEHFADRAVLSWVTLLYLAYPTSVTQGLAMMGCENVGGELWLAADLQEACYKGRHMNLLFLLCLPQVLLFVIGMPLGALLVLWRHRKDLHNPRTQFRWGILYAGYRDELYFWEITIVIRKLVMVMVGGVFASRLGPDMQVYLSLALVVIFVVCHLVAQPFNELTIHHKLLHWLELGALLACFATLYSGMLFYLGHETDRIPSWSLDLASVVIIGGNSSFMIYTIVIFIIAMRREAKESEGLTAAERRLHLRKISKRNSKQKGKEKEKGKGKSHTNDSNKKSSGNNKGVRRRSLQSMKSLASLAVHHDKGVRNIEQHTITKKLQHNKLKRRQSNSKARLNARLHAMKVAAGAANSAQFLSIKTTPTVVGDGNGNGNGNDAVVLAEVKEISLQKVVPREEKVVGKMVVEGGEQQQQRNDQMMIAQSALLPPPPPLQHSIVASNAVQRQVLGGGQQQQMQMQMQMQQQQTRHAQQLHVQQQQPQKPQKLSTYNKLRIEIGRKLASVESDVLFAKLDVDGSNGLSRKEFMRLLLGVSKPNTNKETIRKAWREAIKGDVGKAELNVTDMVEYVHKCGEFYAKYKQYSVEFED
jgi:hypothetical protein